MECAPSDWGRVALTRTLKTQVRATLHAAICDLCGGIIMGKRYLCSICSDYDLCQDCVSCKPSDGHLLAHPLVVLTAGMEKQARDVQSAIAFARSIFELLTSGVTSTECSFVAELCSACKEYLSTISNSSSVLSQTDIPTSSQRVWICAACGQRCCSRCNRCSPRHGVSVQIVTDNLTQVLACVEIAKQSLAVQETQGETKEERTEIFEFTPSTRSCGVLQTRRMEKNDLEGVLAVEGICFMEPYPRTTFERLLIQSSTRCFVAHDLEEVCGYIIVDLGSRTQAKIVSLATRPDQRGNGGASALLKIALKEAAGKSMMTLHVHVDNAGAQRLYGKHGFTVTTRVAGYYGKPESSRPTPQTGDAYAMACPLPSATCVSS